MYHVSAQGVDERMINVHYYYYYVETGQKTMVFLERNLSMHIAYVEFHCL